MSWLTDIIKAGINLMTPPCITCPHRKFSCTIEKELYKLKKELKNK